MRKLTTIFLVGALCFLGIIPALAQQPESWSTLSAYEAATGQKIEKFSEAPALRTKVAAGELPPVEERLPEEPYVIEPLEEIGQYGGTIRVGMIGGYGDASMLNTNEPMLRKRNDLGGELPNLAKSWDFSEDAKTLTLYLRKGLKWSDGMPATAEDVMFWWKDMVLNDEMTPVKPGMWVVGGELAELEKVDDYTIRLHFKEPYLNATHYLSHMAWTMHYRPKHYLKEFHPRYTDKETLERMVKDEGFDFWYELFGHKQLGGAGHLLGNPDCPTLSPFVLRQKKLDYLAAERNPYYWKIDTAGNQLPYINEIFVQRLTDEEVLTAKLISGEFDFSQMHTKLKNISLYKANEEIGDYRVFLYPTDCGACKWQLNMTYKEDPILGEILRDIRFRKALSLGIDREAMNQTTLFGLATPMQAVPLVFSRFYDDYSAKLYIEYDPKEANRLLDEMGLKWDKNHEYRLRSDGKRLQIVLEICRLEGFPLIECSEMALEYWRAIGVDLIMKEETGPLLNERKPANLVQMGAFAFGGTDWHILTTDANNYVAIRNGWEVNWAPLWVDWITSGGEKGEEPPEWVKENRERWEKIQISTSEEERTRLGLEIVRSNAENVQSIGVMGMYPQPIIVKNRLRNVPEEAAQSWMCLWSQASFPETFFLKE